MQHPGIEFKHNRSSNDMNFVIGLNLWFDTLDAHF